MTPTEQAARWLSDVPRLWLQFGPMGEAESVSTDPLPDHLDYVRVPYALAAIARHLAPGDDLVERETAALEGVTPGPWYADDLSVVRTIAPNHDWFIANARSPDASFIAFARQWLPEAAARLSALTAQVAEMQSSQHYRYIGRDGKPVLARDLEDRAEAAKQEVATLRDRLARMEGEAERIVRIAAGLFPGGYDNNLATIRAALSDGGSNG